MYLLASLRMDALPLFMTLTYPSEFPDCPETWKAHLEAFRTWMVRHHPGASAVWKLEPQKRMAPHFHLLVWGVDFIPADVLAAVWYRIVGSGDPRHLLAGTEVRRVYSPNGVKAYAAKAYMGKEFDGFKGVGRFWGVMNKRCLPMGRKESVSVDVYIALIVARTGRRWMAKRGYRVNTGSMEILSSHPEQWERLAVMVAEDEVGNRESRTDARWNGGFLWASTIWSRDEMLNAQAERASAQVDQEG